MRDREYAPAVRYDIDDTEARYPRLPSDFLKFGFDLGTHSEDAVRWVFRAVGEFLVGVDRFTNREPVPADDVNGR